MKINERLKHLRKSRNYTQRQIAKKLGMTHSGYSKYERGERDPGLEVIENLAVIYSITPGAIFVLGTDIDIDKEKNLNVLLPYYDLRRYEMEQLILRFQSRIMEKRDGFAYETQNTVSDETYEDFVTALRVIHFDIEKIKLRMIDSLKPVSFEELLSIPKKEYEKYVKWTEKVTPKKNSI
ncbi:helix-turn-helix transcriptional regulator [Mycoplasmatota bacterium zrk1]